MEDYYLFITFLFVYLFIALVMAQHHQLLLLLYTAQW